MQPFLKLDRRHCSRFLTVHTEHGEEIIGKIHTAGVKTDFVAAEFDTGHIHDPQKLCRGHQNIPAQSRDRSRKLIQFPYAGQREVRDRSPVLLYSGHFRGKTGYWTCQPAAADQTADQSDDQHKENAESEQQNHMVGEGKQLPKLHCSDQKPLLGGERCIAVVEA